MYNVYIIKDVKGKCYYYLDRIGTIFGYTGV